MTNEQFDALLKLMRGDRESPGCKAVRAVLVEGGVAARVAIEYGISKQAVGQSVKRYRLAAKRQCC